MSLIRDTDLQYRRQKIDPFSGYFIPHNHSSVLQYEGMFCKGVHFTLKV